MNFQNIKIWLFNLDEYTIKEIEIPENVFNRKKYLEKNDLYVIYDYRSENIYFQLTEESSKTCLRKYIQTSIDMKQRELETLKTHLSNI